MLSFSGARAHGGGRGACANTKIIVLLPILKLSVSNLLEG